MGDLAYFPFYPRDFASSGKVEAMTTEAVGAYILLLCKAWLEDPPASIPNDDNTLARWARMTTVAWAGVRSQVLACFAEGPDGRLYNSRMQREHVKAAGLRSVRSEAGRVGAAAKWQSDGKRIARPLANASVCSSSTESESESESEKTKNPPNPPATGGKAAAPPGPAWPDIPKALDTPEVGEAIAEYRLHRRELKAKWTPRMESKLLKGWSANWWTPERVVAAIDHTISNGWQGIKEPDHHGPNRGGTQSQGYRPNGQAPSDRRAALRAREFTETVSGADLVAAANRRHGIATPPIAGPDTRGQGGTPATAA